MQMCSTHSRFPLYNSFKTEQFLTLMHVCSYICCCSTDKNSTQWTFGLVAWRTRTPSFINFLWVCLYECICYASEAKNGAASRPLWTHQLSGAFCLLAHSLFFFLPAFYLLSFLLYFFPKPAATIFSLSCQPLPILQPLTLTLTLPCLCHWDKSERYHILSFLPLCCRVEFCLSHQSYNC